MAAALPRARSSIGVEGEGGEEEEGGAQQPYACSQLCPYVGWWCGCAWLCRRVGASAGHLQLPPAEIFGRLPGSDVHGCGWDSPRARARDLAWPAEEWKDQGAYRMEKRCAVYAVGCDESELARIRWLLARQPRLAPAPAGGPGRRLRPHRRRSSRVRSSSACHRRRVHLSRPDKSRSFS